MRSAAITLLTAIALTLAVAAHAAETKPFDQATFLALQAAGQPILIDVYADWCPTCKAQEPIVSELLARPQFVGYTRLKVNFDTQKDVRREFGVSQQSTFIIFRGSRELGRSTGDTHVESIASLLSKGTP
jgi:thioredoxin-like negative regulator of GroEL